MQVNVSDSKDSDGNADTVVDATITVNIAVTNVNEGAPPAVDFTLTEIRATTVLVTVTPPDTANTSPIKRYVVSYTNTSTPTDFGITGIESGTTVTLTGLIPSTAYTIRVLAHNEDGVNGPVTAKDVTTGANTAPTSADFTKKVSRQTGATFSKSDFPFTDADTGDALSKVKIVTLPGHTDIYGKTTGVLRFDGTDAAVGQEVSADDLGKLKYVPQPDGFRVDIGGSFTFKVLDRDGAESPAYTVTLEQIADIILTLSPDSINESSTPSSGGRVTVTATLTGPVRSSATTIPQIRVAIDHDARENSDYTVNINSQALTIPAGQKGASITFDFTGIEDFLVEGDEEIKIYPTWVINLVTTTPTDWVDPVYLTLEDNDRAVVSITGPPGEVEEGEDAVFTVTLSRGITKALTVAWSASAGTASAGDYIGSSGTVTFPAGVAGQRHAGPSPSQSLMTSFPRQRNGFSVTLGAITGKPASQVSIVSGKGTASANIAENDAVTVSISGDERVTEGESATYTFSLDSGASTQAITVDYTTTDKTAEAGTDYTAASGTVTIAAGQTSATVTVDTTENTDDAANTYFEFRISNPQGGGGPTPLLSTTQFVNTTIVDDDGDPSSVVLSVDKSSFGESDTAGTVNVTATLEGGTLEENATVVVTLGGTATKGSSGDYTATTLGNITITGGESSGTASFTVTPVTDEIVEGDETIELSGASAGLDVTPATITITDDDTATLGITGPAGVVSEGSNAEFTVTLSHAVASQVVVAWSAGSTATVPASADDYSPDSGSVIFPAGSAAGATKTITMAIADDSTEEEQETFTVTLGSITGDLASRVSLDSAKSGADATIATGATVTVTLLGPRAFAHERNTDFAVYHVLLSGPVNADIQVDVKTSNGTATGCDGGVNSCSGGQTGDYVNVSDTLTIGPSRDTQHNANDFGVTWYTVFVYFVSGSTGDADETFTLSLSNLRGGGTTPVVLGDSSVTTTIKSTPLAFSVSGPEFVDEGTKARFIVTRNVDLHAALGARVSYATSDGTATAGTDYTAVSGRLEMPITAYPNVPTIEEIQRRYSDWEILVPITADNVDESDETFTLTLSNPQTYYAGYSGITDAALGTATATTTIRDQAMQVSVSGPETVVEGGNADFTVSLSRAPTANLTVNYQTYSALAPARLATSGADFTPQSGTLTFVPGETSKRVRVPVLADTIREPVEYFRLLLSSPSGGGGLTPTLGTSIATTGIVDAAGPLLGATLTVTPNSSVGEGDTSATTFTVKVDLDCCTTFDEDTTVTVSLGGTATGTDDYTANIANVTIPASTAIGSATLSITPVDDSVYEGKETIVVKGSLTGFVVFPDTIDLAENDLAHITLSFDPEYVQEGSDVQVALTATRDGTVGDHAIDWSGAWSSQTATDNTDYTQGGGGSCDRPGTDYFIRVLPSDVRIAPGQSSASTTMTFHICADELDDPNETIAWSATSPGATFTAAVLTIGEPETVALSLSPETVAEDAGATEVTVTATLSAARPTDTVVNLTLGGSAANPADYTATTLSSITIPRGQTSATGTLTITPVDDAVPEGDETITVSGASGARTVSSADITITDDEEPAAITLTVNPEYVQEGQRARQVTLTATRDGTVGDHTIDLSVGGGTATDGKDYTIWTFSPAPRIAPGETSATFTLTFTVNTDNEDEGNESVILSGTAPGAVVTDAVVTIGQPESIALSVNPDSIAEDAGATEVTVTATLSAARDTSTTVNITVGGTATELTDYNTTTALASITIPRGQTTADGTLAITPIDDTEVEGDETITISGKSGARTVSSADITIADNDVPVISFETAPESVNEGETASYVVKVEGNRTTNITVKFKTGAPGDLATAGQDYTAVDQTITFLPTDDTKTVTVSTLSDNRFEPAEDFTVTLSNARSGDVAPPVIKNGTKTTTINDNFTDNPAYPDTYTLTAIPSAVSEGDGATQITFTATLAGTGTFPHPVDVLVYVEGEQGLKGTAALNEDYTVAGSHGEFLVFSIPANSTSGAGTLTLTPVDDSVIEEDETAVFTSLSGGGLSTSDRPTITLEDDDAPTHITLSVSPSVLREGSSDEGHNVMVTATLSGDLTLSGSVDVSVSLSDGTAKNEDYSKATVTVTIPAGQLSGSANLKVNVKGDDKAEEDETLDVTGTAAGFTVYPAEITILDDDSGRRGIRLTVSPNRIREDAEATVLSVTASWLGKDAPPVDVPIHLSLADGTATLADGDYSAATGTLTIPAGQLYGIATFTFTPTSDAVVESDETVLLTAALEGINVFPAEITIINSSHADLSLGGPSAPVAEGSTATFTVTLSAAVSEAVTVPWFTAPNTAVAADYSPAGGSVTFPAGSAAGATQTFTVTMTDDNLSEVLENFTVELGEVTSSVSAFVAPKSGSFIADAYIAESDPITVTISGPSTVSEGDTTTVYTVSLSPVGVTPTADLTVDYATSDGTATAGEDYEAASGTLTFTPTAAGPQTFTIQTTEDTIDESGETFTVTLDTPTGGGGPASRLGTSSVTTTITDDDSLSWYHV